MYKNILNVYVELKIQQNVAQVKKWKNVGIINAFCI